MEFIKGYYNEDGKFIPEGQEVKVITILGESVKGRLLKPAKKQFMLQIQEVVRVFRVEEIEEFDIATDEDEE